MSRLIVLSLTFVLCAIKTIAQLQAPFCPGETYFDSRLNARACCPSPSRVQWIDNCAGTCISNPSPPNPIQAPFPEPIPGSEQTGACGNDLASCTCANSPVCGKGNELGIKYGHCYIISFADGQQLGALRDKTDQYQKGGFFTDIPFKVCATTGNCLHGGSVKRNDKFNLQDQHGRYDDPNATKGWIDNSHNGNHVGFTTDHANAGQFSGIPTCANGKCAISLLGGPDASGGIGYACPMETPGITFYANPKTTLKLQFSEVTCDDYEVPLTSDIRVDPANVADYGGRPGNGYGY